uniref:PB1 domain-containing protein n=1 Tax=Oryza barthii TaxID=65489 RepID=A0A0D3G7W5_9ORYZ
MSCSSSDRLFPESHLRIESKPGCLRVEAMAARPTTSESGSTTTDDDVHLSPTSICSGGGGGACVVVGGSRIKILCSFGGRIMPRPSDGALKYIGGETRVLAVPRSIPFSDLKKKVEEMFRTEVAAIKYQLVAEDLDVLVSVTCDEDLTHMLDEYDRFEAKRSPSASPRFRVYVFSSQPPVAAAVPSTSRHAGYAPPASHHHLLQHHLHHFQPDHYVATPDGSPPYAGHSHGAVSAGNSPRADAVGPDHPAGGFHSYYHPHGQYAPAPVPVPHHAGVGRYDTRGGGGYVRGSNYVAAPPPPMMPVAVRSGRPVSRGGGAPPYNEMHTPKNATTIWD